MSQNYTLLKRSEETIIENFNNYLKFAFDMFSKYKAIIENFNEENIVNGVKEIDDLEKQSDLMHLDLTEELIWDLSKDQPLLTHLRWYVCALNSIRDIERICDYIDLNIKSHNKMKIMPEFLQRRLLEIINYIYLIFEKFLAKVTNMEAVDFFESFMKEMNEFDNYYQNVLNNLIKDFEDVLLFSQKHRIRIGLIFHNYNRIMERLENIIENIVFIHDPEYFRRKLNQEKSL
ncbi:PhoU domain-containing protein [Mycoplasmopsis opalescens]|uniref:PhoU domain-containing protein n=1 Tax=Mycoplasmopsis opalescens TaxID=114886 RepID=UPI0004A715C2|nr:PhoU domain-containing protein [Mycoplasmopsis opalescens]